MSNAPSPSTTPGGFLLCACQGGAEAALKSRAAAVLPAAKPAAWRRGIVSFKLPPAAESSAAGAPALPVDLLERLVFARTAVHSLGQVTGADPATLAKAAVELAGHAGFANVHVWPRQFEPGPRGAEVATAAAEARRILLAGCGLASDLDPVAGPGDRVLDVVLDTEERWWVGWHFAAEPATCWPGGIYPPAGAPLPAGKVSRAWLKLDEAIATFGIEWGPRARAVELGCAPGGACQRLLEAGLDVVGVDPALVDPAVAAQPRFTQWRMRAREVPLRRFAGVDWLLADMNIDPTSTLESLGRAAGAKGAALQGIVATLKIPDWSRAAELPAWLAAFRDWGFAPRARQLSSGGREICVVARRVMPTAGARSATKARPASSRRPLRSPRARSRPAE
jgi:23S rRNA (cytidine2498-2'-O)-methyltransferase